MNMKILVTGVAGFIGFHLSKGLLGEGCNVICLDDLNDYCDVRLRCTGSSPQRTIMDPKIFQWDIGAEVWYT